MAIIITADTAAELPEQIRSTAKEEGGKFVVSPPEGWGVDNVAATRGQLTKAAADLKRRDERLKAFAKDDKGTIYEADEFAALVAEHRTMKDAQGKTPSAEDLRKAIVAEYEAKFGKKITDFEKLTAQQERDLDNMALESTISSLVAEMRPKEGKAELVKLLLQQRLGVDKEDGKRVSRVRSVDGKDWMPGTGPDGYLTPKDYAMNVLRTQHADIFQGDGASGAGAGPNSGGRRTKYTFPRADLNGRANEFFALEARAAADGGQKVELV